MAIRNYALAESEVNTMRAALLLVENHLLGKLRELVEYFNEDEEKIKKHPMYAPLQEKLENVKAALDALK